MDINYALGVIDSELFDHDKPWGQHTEELRKAVQTLRGFVAEQQERPAKIAAESAPAEDTQRFLVVAELREIIKHLTFVNGQLARGTVSTGSHNVFDTNGEKVGRVVFNEIPRTFVFEFDYVEGNHE